MQTLSGSSQARAKRLFKTIGEKEQILQQDLFALNKEMTIQLLQETVFLNYTTLSSMREAIAQVMGYKDWVKNNLSDVDIIDFSCAVDDIDIPDLYPYKFFKDGKTMLQTLVDIFDINQTIEICCVATYLLYVNGLSLFDISFLERKQMDFSKQIINIKNKQNEYKVNMLPDFIEFYQQICTIDECKGKRTFELNTNFVIPVSGEKRTWYTNFNSRANEIIKKNQTVLEQKLPSNLDFRIIKQNGLLYRTYCTQFYSSCNTFFTPNDEENEELDIIYSKFLQAFY